MKFAWSFPNWGFTLICTIFPRIHTDSIHTNGLKHKPFGLLQISTTSNPLQLYTQHMDHTGRWHYKSPANQTFKIISNYFQHQLAFLSPPVWHLLLQRKEVMETSLKGSCLGTLYLANSEVIQMTCQFKIAEAWEKIFEVAKNTWAVYSIKTINTNQVCPNKNSVDAKHIQSRDVVMVNPGCFIRTMDHVILAAESEVIEIQMKTMDWAGVLRPFTRPSKVSWPNIT